MNGYAKAIVAGMVTAALIDLRAFNSARSSGVGVKFDWVLFLSRLLTGALTGLTTAGLGSIAE